MIDRQNAKARTSGERDLSGRREDATEVEVQALRVLWRFYQRNRRMALDSHRDSFLVLVAGPSLLVSLMDHATIRFLLFHLLLLPFLFNGALR